MGLNEVFSSGWGTNAVQADVSNNPPRHKSCMTTQFGSLAFKACDFTGSTKVTASTSSTKNKSTIFYVLRVATRIGSRLRTLDAQYLCQPFSGSTQELTRWFFNLMKANVHTLYFYHWFQVLVHWGENLNATRCYLPKTHGKHGWCKTKNGDWGFCYPSCNEISTKPVQKTKELRVGNILDTTLRRAYSFSAFATNS
jgi:hypothetical protein